jgi:hypothetical protein
MPVITMQASQFTSPSDTNLLMSLLTKGQRPALLVLCCEGGLHPVVNSMMTWCEPPVHRCDLPGYLDLPLARGGTLVLTNAAALTLEQQVELYDWLDARRAVQVVSVTSKPIWPLVEQGRFLEGLFYRLNVVTLEASGTM